MKLRLLSVLAFSAAAFLAAAVAHPAGVAAAPKAPPSASPSPSPSPSATPEPLDKAIPRLEARLKTNPDDKPAQIDLAVDYLQVNRPDLAIQLTQKLLAGGTKTAQVYYFDGLAQNGLGRQREAIADLENAANLEPTNPGVLGMLTNAYLQQNRPQDAERVAKRAVTFNKTDLGALMAYGQVLAAEGKYDEARAQFEAAAQGNPKDVAPLLAEAQVYLRQNAVALASGLYDRAIAIDPTNTSALLGKARLDAGEHNVKDAIATYDKVLGLATAAPDKVAVLDQEALVYASEKMDGDADAMYRKAIAQYPDVPSAHTAYGDYLRTKNDNAGAEREWLAGQGPNKDQGDALYRLGQLYASQNQLPKAIDEFKRLADVDANDPRSHQALAAAYMASRQFDKARDQYKAMYGLQHSPDALLGLGQADLETHNYTEGAQVYDALDHAADLSRQNPSILYGLGQCYQHLNQPAKAKTAYVKLLGYVKPGSQAATQVKQLIAQVEKQQQKPAPKKK